ncbi:MAG: hypothetical protein AVDCRST_MAG43-903 [uncultured Thermomicrobiales bacterium]|uniref:Uncharacterized protein n=1 Tax=uncultured Thermomicrobiales bacterium TaxID=1645740 RepID=A0A6J4UIL0_9BACT|nr:MAG: hypothetical protein AVDCRST_MAG43-903 [uncultured Thermomicrobiales bacterium]
MSDLFAARPRAEKAHVAKHVLLAYAVSSERTLLTSRVAGGWRITPMGASHGVQVVYATVPSTLTRRASSITCCIG